jgi:choline-sulfatase
MPNQTPAGYNRPPSSGPDSWSPSDPRFEGYWRGGRHWSEVLGDDAVQFLRQAAGREQAFFMYLAFNAPHDPRQSPAEFVDRYPLDHVSMPVNFLPEYPYKEAIGCGVDLRDEKLAPFPRTEHAVKVNRQEYYAIITHMDEQIGRILAALAESGKEEETYIFFTADHGLAVGQHGLMGKQNMYDHSVRVPFIVVGPGVAAGEENSTPIYLQDVMPTTLELAGVARPAHVQFQSLGPLLRGEAARPYDAMYGAYLQLQRMVTMDGFKLIVYPRAKRLRLYNLKDDPFETQDLAEDAAHRDTVRRLFSRLLELQEEMDDALDLRGTFPDV